MKYSIQKKMFLISLLTTALSFFLVLVSFNVITNYHIKQQTVMELSHAVAAAEPLSVTITDPGPESISGSAVTFSPTLTAITSMSSVSIDGSAENLSASLSAQIASMDGVGFILSGPSGSVDQSIHFDPFSPVGSPGAAEEPDTVTALRSYARLTDAATPVRATLNDTSYYVVKAEIADLTEVVFYKNVQPLEDLAAQVNVVLLILLLISGCLAVAVSMGLSRGMVRSIRKLCSFAGAVGAGDLSERELDLREKELAILGDEMNEMIRKLAAHDTEQKTFFQNVSHELRTPLMSIQGYAEGIADSMFSGGELRDAAEIILAESDRLTEMVGNLLYLSRMDSPGRSEKKEVFDCAEVLEQAVDQTSPLAAAKNIRLELHQEETNDGTPSGAANDRSPSGEANGRTPSCEGGGLVLPAFGNREDFQRAILCILENALRYARSRVVVSLNPHGRTVRIADDGPGISDEDMPHIFQRFYKGKDGLSGIGLAIADAAVRGLGGTLSAENSGGACFTISLPDE